MVTNKEGYLREYYLKNKEKYNSKRECEICKMQYLYTHKTRHNNGKKHKLILEERINNGEIKYNEETHKYEIIINNQIDNQIENNIENNIEKNI